MARAFGAASGHVATPLVTHVTHSAHVEGPALALARHGIATTTHSTCIYGTLTRTTAYCGVAEVTLLTLVTVPAVGVPGAVDAAPGVGVAPSWAPGAAFARLAGAAREGRAEVARGAALAVVALVAFGAGAHIVGLAQDVVADVHVVALGPPERVALEEGTRAGAAVFSGSLGRHAVEAVLADPAVRTSCIVKTFLQPKRKLLFLNGPRNWALTIFRN